MQTATVYMALGANLGHRADTLRRAVAALSDVVAVTTLSSVYETEPAYVLDQPRFYNLALTAETTLGPYSLLRVLKSIETELGRRPGVRFGARAIDLDIIIFDDVIMDTPDLTVPHPRLAERPFVLAPLAEIAPGLIVPIHHQTVAELLKALGDISSQAWSRGPLAALDLDAEDAA